MIPLVLKYTFPKLLFVSQPTGTPKLEIAMTGSALPVLLNISPQSHFDFGDCPVGEHVDALCSLRNDSSLLPATYTFQRVAQFSIHPSSGKLRPGESQDLIFSFKVMGQGIHYLFMLDF